MSSHHAGVGKGRRGGHTVAAAGGLSGLHAAKEGASGSGAGRSTTTTGTGMNNSAGGTTGSMTTGTGSGGSRTAAAGAGGGGGGQGEDGPKIDWSSFPTSVLVSYKNLHQLDIPPSFTSARNERLLCPLQSPRPSTSGDGTGIGRMSPTMARRRAQQRVSKEKLVMAVRKDFNAGMVVEGDLLTAFLYTVENQDKTFRMRFEPQRR